MSGYSYDVPLCCVSQFTGKERDAETGLDYSGARYYGSNVGRFVSPDEFAGGPVSVFGGDPTPPGPLPYADIGNPQSLNKYAYGYNNPLKFIDPDGHSSLVFDGEEKTITLYDKDNKQVGHWDAANNVDSHSGLKNGLPDGTYDMQDTKAPHTHDAAKDSKDGEYGTVGIFRVKDFSGPDKDAKGNLNKHQGVGVHAGRENKPDGLKRKGPEHATQGCIRMTEDAMKQIKTTAKDDPLTYTVVVNNRTLKKNEEVKP
ncbi:MAG TPA: RHS repeat-associated core domain-containing protein [Terriglobales bacterium]|nr:RHS repeat-associated core domain-containing protein [Terriglobales bacterium]